MNRIKQILRQRSGLTLIYIICIMALITALCLSVVYAGSQTYLAAVNRVETVRARQQAQSLTQTLAEQITETAADAGSAPEIQSYLSESFPTLPAPVSSSVYDSTGACEAVTFTMTGSGNYGDAALTFQRYDPLRDNGDDTTTAYRDLEAPEFCTDSTGTIDYSKLVIGYFTLKLSVTVDYKSTQATTAAYFDASRLGAVDYFVNCRTISDNTVIAKQLFFSVGADNIPTLTSEDGSLSWAVASCFNGTSTTGTTLTSVDGMTEYSFFAQTQTGVNGGCIYALEHYE